MINCKDLYCVKELAKDILKKENSNITEDFNIIFVTLPPTVISKLDGNTLKINLLKYESFTIQTSGENELNSSFVMLAILNAFFNDIEKIRKTILKYFGEDSVVYRLIEIMFQ